MPIRFGRSTRHLGDIANYRTKLEKVKMTNKMNVAACLVVGMMTISTVVAPSASQARTIEMSQAQAKISTEAVGHFQAGLMAASTGDLANALGKFDRAIAINPQYFQAYIERGNVKDSIRDFAGAVIDYTTAISLNAKSAPAYYNRGTVLSQSGKHSEAILDYRRAISIDPRYAQAHLNLANELDDLGDKSAALANYDRAISLKPNYALAYLNRGIMHERAGNRPKAIADLNKAVKIFQSLGQIDRAKRALQLIKDIQSEV
jgi:tetratricopeptide (TPR) repeat protein